MTLTQIRYFLAVCRHGSVTRAAETLHISQPSVSTAIRELEDEFGISLFHRIKMRLSLTLEGQFFRDQCEALLHTADHLSSQMKDLGNRPGSIRIGVPPMIGTFLFPTIFNGFHRAYPEVEIEMIEHGSRKIREMVLSEDLDIAIAIIEPKRDTAFHIIPLLTTTLLFSVAPSHPLASRSEICLEELEGEPLIFFREDSHQTNLLREQFAQKNLHPKILLSSSQLYTIRKMLADGEAGAFLFREVVAQDSDILGIPLAEPLNMEICLIWKKDRHMFSDTTRLIQFVQQLLLFR